MTNEQLAECIEHCIATAEPEGSPAPAIIALFERLHPRRGGLTYAQVENLLATNHGASDGSTAFRGRLKNLQKHGVPVRTRPGKGAKLDYDAETIWQMGVAVELAFAGHMPAAACDCIKRRWAEIYERRYDDELAFEVQGERLELVDHIERRGVVVVISGLRQLIEDALPNA